VTIQEWGERWLPVHSCRFSVDPEICSFKTELAASMGQGGLRCLQIASQAETYRVALGASCGLKDLPCRSAEQSTRQFVW
jgi:hypothetical protein